MHFTRLVENRKIIIKAIRLLTTVGILKSEYDQETIQLQSRAGDTMYLYTCLRYMYACLHPRLYETTSASNKNYLHPFIPSDGIEAVMLKLENWLSKAGVL